MFADSSFLTFHLIFCGIFPENILRALTYILHKYLYILQDTVQRKAMWKQYF